jgi:hypothetical protein
MRRFLIILAILIVLGGLGAAAYFFIFAKSSSLVVDTSANPFGNPAGGAPSASDTTGTVDTSGGETVAGTVVTQRLIKISAGPVVPGEVAFTLASSTSSTTPADTEVRYVLRESGNIFSYLFRARSAERLVNKTIPGVQEASWLPDGSLAYLRYLGGTPKSPELDTYALPADGTTGFFLPLNLSELMTMGSSSVFSLSSGGNGSIGTISKADGSSGRTVFSSPLGSLVAKPAGAGRFVAYTKPTSLTGGYVFLVDTAGTFTRLFGPATGLTALPSPSGSWTLLSYVDQGNFKTLLMNLKTREIIPLPIATLSEKCTWTADESALYCGVPVPGSLTSATYPDDWYQGAVSFTDRVWKIDVAGRFAQLVLDFSATTQSPLDATALTLDAKNDVLVFLNKRDGALWAYDL